ncbi:MAG: lipoprotein insertase outer membrane protein LolB [Proteobacteria bacterium]|nr:lipoprotein insertase outer membrane protein LolB [Pseudomonadota bacterium]
MLPYPFYKLVIFLFLFSLLTACNRSQIKPSDKISRWNQVKSWSFNGKMAINDGKNNGSGRIIWEVKHNSSKAQFKAPLGQGSWTIIETPFDAKLKSSRKGESSARDAKTLIAREIGWEFPWDSLKYWVRGYQTGQILSPHLTLPSSINDNGWIINYQKWMNTSIGPLPKKIKATKDNYSVKLVIYDWDIK